MPNVYGTPQLWLLRAREAREMADNISDLGARQCMLDIAGNYEKIAARAHIRAAVGVPGKHSLEAR